MSSFGKAPSVKDQIVLSVAITFAATAPDLDVVPGLLIGKPALYHSWISHSFAFALLVSMAIAGLLKTRGFGFVPVFVMSLIAYSSHLGMDLLGPDAREPIGIPLFWPVIDETYLSPITPLMGVKHATSTSTGTVEWIANLISLRNVIAILIETAVTTPILIIGILLNRRSLKALKESQTEA